jgi:parallel beta-helix repeat protein
MMLISGLTLLFLVLNLGSADCKSLTVCKEGCDFASVKAAVDAADPGDTVEVESGIYKENVKINKSLALIGKDTGAGKPVIDAAKKGSAVSILADGITLVGFNLTNAFGSRADFYAGIRVWGNNSVLKDNQAFYNENGILMTNSINGTVENNLLITNKYGMRLERSRDARVKGNEMKDNNYGLLIVSSEGCMLRSNLAEDNDNGIKLNDSENNTLIDNLMKGNIYNFGAEGNNNVSFGNLVDEKPILYLRGIENKTIDSSVDVGTVYCLDCENVTIRGLNLSNNFYGISLQNSTGSIIEKNDLKNVVIGIALVDSYGNMVSENQIVESQGDGLKLIDSDRNRLESNNVDKYGRGLFVLRSGFNEINRNRLQNGSTGIYLDSSWDNRLFGNFISRNRIGLNTASTVMNIITMNNITNNTIGIRQNQFDRDTLDNRLENNSKSNETIERSTAGVFSEYLVEITSYPEKASVLIDGKPQKWKTPGTASFAKSGKHKLELRLDKMKKTKDVIINEDNEETEPIFVDFESDE